MAPSDGNRPDTGPGECRIDAALRAQEALQAAIDSLDDGLVLYDRDDRLVACNQSFRRLFPKIADAIVPGVTFEALTRVGLERGQYREAAGQTEDWLVQRIAAHRNLAEPYELELDDGRWLRVVERRTPDGGTVGLRVDITELKRHELMLAEKTALLEAAFDSSLDAVIVADERGRVIAANRQVIAVFGYAPEEMVDRDLVNLIVPERLRERHLAGIERFLRTGEGPILRRRIEVDALRKDGSEIPIELTVVDARAPGHVLFTAFARDISSRRAAEALKENYERLNAIFDTEAAFVVALGADGQVVRANATAAELLRAAFTGRENADFRALFPTSRRTAPEGGAGAAGERLCAETFDTEVALPEGRTRYITWKTSPTHLSGERIEVLVGIDVSAKRQAEMAMYQASKLVTLGEMATGLAHELNQPLAVIRLAVENIRASLTGMEKSPEYFAGKIQRIEEQVLRSREIIDNMRIFGRTPKDGPEPFDAGSATLAALSLTRKQIEGAGIRLDYAAPSEACTILGRPTLLQQVLINLVLNARDAILERRQGERRAEPADDFIRVAILTRAADTGPTVCIEIADTGGGIPPAVLPRIFEPFFTTKPAGKGTGLGLSVSFGIVTEMNGRIAASNHERGAVFAISLPRVA